MILVETGVLLAALVDSDPRHEECADALRRYASDIWLPAPIIPEVGYFLERDALHLTEAAVLRSFADGRFRVIDPVPADFARGADLVEQYADFPLGTVDALIMAAAERLDVTTILTLDRRHFGAVRPRHAAAFTLVP